MSTLTLTAIIQMPFSSQSDEVSATWYSEAVLKSPGLTAPKRRSTLCDLRTCYLCGRAGFRPARSRRGGSACVGDEI